MAEFSLDTSIPMRLQTPAESLPQQQERQATLDTMDMQNQQMRGSMDRQSKVRQLLASAPVDQETGRPDIHAVLPQIAQIDPDTYEKMSSSVGMYDYHQAIAGYKTQDAKDKALKAMDDHVGFMSNLWSDIDPASPTALRDISERISQAKHYGYLEPGEDIKMMNAATQNPAAFIDMQKALNQNQKSTLEKLKGSQAESLQNVKAEDAMDIEKSKEENALKIAEMRNNALLAAADKKMSAYGYRGTLGSVVLQRLNAIPNFKIENGKVANAIHAKALLSSSIDPNTGLPNINQIQLPELAMTLANLVSGSNSHTVEEFREIKPQSFAMEMRKFGGMLSDMPENMVSPEWVKNIDHLITRQAQVSEQTRNDYIPDITQAIAPDDENGERVAELVRNALPNFERRTGAEKPPAAAKTESLPTFNSLEEAKAAGLKPGTRVIINGVKGKLK